MARLTEATVAPDRIKILVLAANPEGTGHLRLDQEVRAIDRALRESEYRDRFELLQHWAVSVDDLQGLLLRHQPHIVHFSGHGSRQGAIVLEANRGRVAPHRDIDLEGQTEPAGQPGQVSARSLSRTFHTLKDNVRCVVLNACYTETQARAIAEHIDVVIGMNRAISDEAAIRFASAYYLGLGYGRDIQTAYELGCASIELEGLEEQDTPQVLAPRIDPREIILLPSPADVNEPHPGPAQVRKPASADVKPRVGWNTIGLSLGVVGLSCMVVLAFLASLFVYDLPRPLRSAVLVAAVVAACAVLVGAVALARGSRHVLRHASQWLGSSPLAKTVFVTLLLSTAVLFWTAGLPKIACIRGVTCGLIFVEPFANLGDAKRIIGQKLAVVAHAGVGRPALQVYGQGQDRLTDEMRRLVNRIIGGEYDASAVSAYVERADGRLLSSVDVPADGVESVAERLELYTEVTVQLLARLGVHVDTELHAAIAAIPTTDPQAWDHKLRGDALMAAGQLDEAAALFEDAIALDDAYADAHAALGMVREQQGSWQEAAASYQRAIDVLPGYVVFEFNLGNLLRQYAPPDGVNDAINVLEGVIERDPTFVGARAALGATYLDLGRLDEARDILEGGLRLAPENAPIHNGLGLVEILSGRPTEALARFEMANRFDPTYAPAYLNHAEALVGLDRWRDAASVYDRAAAERPGDPIFPYRLGELYAEQRLPERAVELLEEAVRIAPDFLDARRALGEVLIGLGDLDTARFHVNHALLVDPDLAPLYNARGLIERAAGEPEKALASFEQSTQLDATYREALQNRADLLYELGQDEEAIRVQERANQVIAIPIDPLDRFVYDGPIRAPRCGPLPCP